MAIEPKARFYLLIPPKRMLIGWIGSVRERMNWTSSGLAVLWFPEADGTEYEEWAVAGAGGELDRIYRRYRHPRKTWVGLTRSASFAHHWAHSSEAAEVRREIRRATPPGKRFADTPVGALYKVDDAKACEECVLELMRYWPRPSITHYSLNQPAKSVWAPKDLKVDPHAKLVGPVWIGCGHRPVDQRSVIIGPRVVWDDPDTETTSTETIWPKRVTTPAPPRFHHAGRSTAYERFIKRPLDVAVAVLLLAMLAPLWPMIVIAIWLEDGGPILFAHRRESRNGRNFPCLKFRSMRKNAEAMKQELREQNQVDGPQFFIKNDPRMTRVGRFLRASNLDECPQLLNVLLGHMALVGPRPSPRKENQYCPAWRVSRLSVRPGITGLWQVSRRRESGEDFREWIRYDLEYVNNLSFTLDMMIVCRTLIYVGKPIFSPLLSFSRGIEKNFKKTRENPRKNIHMERHLT
ncbi:MAG: sugar transferase [Planctomycetota bacterium]